MSEETKNTVAAEEAAAEETAAEAAAEQAQPTEAELLKQELAAEKDKYLRLAAEYDNYRKRTAKEKENIYTDAKIDTLSKFLEVYDNLERAVMQEGDDDNAHKKGMVMIFNQLTTVLEKMGVTIEDPTGKEFDPEKHNAVMHIEDENLGENTVTAVFQKGFLMGEKVVRFATVQVAN